MISVPSVSIFEGFNLPRQTQMSLFSTFEGFNLPRHVWSYTISVPSVSIFPWLYYIGYTFLDMSFLVKNFFPSWKDIPHQCAYYVQCNSNLKNIIPRTCNKGSHMIENKNKSCKRSKHNERGELSDLAGVWIQLQLYQRHQQALLRYSIIQAIHPEIETCLIFW